MEPSEEKLFILDLLKLNKSERMYSEETVINIIKQTLKMSQPVEQEKPSESAEEKPCNKCEFNGRSSPCEQCNPTNDYEHFFYHDPYSKESMDFFRVFIKARKELCAISPTNTYSFEEAIRKTFDDYASQKHLPTDCYPKEFCIWIGYSYGFHDLAYREIDNDWVYFNKAYTLDELFIYWQQNTKA